MNYSTLTQLMEPNESTLGRDIDPLSVYALFEHIKDKRKKRGVRYPMAFILTLILLAKLAGETTLAGVADWVRLRGDDLQKALPGTRGTFPCAATYSNVLRAIDAEQLPHILTQGLLRMEAAVRCEDEPSRFVGQKEREKHVHIAMDGKTLRGTLSHEAEDQKKMHQVTLYEPQTGLILKEQVVGEKQNELSLLSEFLLEKWVKGRILTVDALFTQHTFCSSVTRWGGEYMVIAKGNQPTLLDDLRLFFDEPPTDCRDWRTACTHDKGHGRLEQRSIIATTELNDFLSTWAGIAQVFCITRVVKEKGKERREVVVGITSLPPAKADAHQLLTLNRDHWKIENRLHWRRDVTLQEDHCQVRKGVAPRILALLNSFLLSLLDFLGVENVAKQARIFDAKPAVALRLLLGPLPTFK
ncbi:ISAs1 family transposase [Dictyobacter arantiisoli]|nr:ISAs1 family transposase [Dictyobacter arantiisoli]